MAEQDLDRNEKATPFKLQRAREQGTVAKSADVNAFAILAVATLACFAWLPAAIRELALLMARIWQSAGMDLARPEAAGALLKAVIVGFLNLLAPLLLGVAAAAVIANLAQTGPVFSVKPVTPDFSRLNPAQGFKRLFSVRLVYEALKSGVKLGLLAGVLGAALIALLPSVSSLQELQGAVYIRTLLDLAGGVMAKLLGVLLVLATVDFAYTQREYAKRMRMSRREIKDEHKQREGDPRIRQRIRELRMQLLKRTRALRQLPQADVLITNPTRVAVALGYQHGVVPAPRVIAKGTGPLARKMRDVAFRHGVPIVHSAPLARALYREVDDGGYVPEQWYPQVAKILVWVLSAKRAADKTARAGARA